MSVSPSHGSLSTVSNTPAPARNGLYARRPGADHDLALGDFDRGAGIDELAVELRGLLVLAPISDALCQDEVKCRGHDGQLDVDIDLNRHHDRERESNWTSGWRQHREVEDDRSSQCWQHRIDLRQERLL